MILLLRSKDESNVRSRQTKANKTAIRYLVYWTLGIIISLGIDIYRRGIDPTNWIPMAMTLLVFLIAGVAYLRCTVSEERRADAIRKLIYPTYE